MKDFAARYTDLEARWRELAAAEGSIYVPNPVPAGRVDYVLVAMEPSGPSDDLRAWIAAGFRNFLRSPDDFILHWSVRRYLCGPGQTYHITDVSKGAMTVKEANRDRRQRWDRWWPSLAAEIELLSKSDGATKIVVVGKSVHRFLQRQGCRMDGTVLHYSPQAVRWRSKAVQGHDDAFAEFASLTLERVVSEAAMPAMTAAQVPDWMQRRTLERLPGYLSHSQKQLAFTYRRAFAGLTASRSRK